MTPTQKARTSSTPSHWTPLSACNYKEHFSVVEALWNNAEVLLGLAGAYPTLWRPQHFFVRVATDQHLLALPLPHLLHPSSYFFPSHHQVAEFELPMTTHCDITHFLVLVKFPQWIKSCLFLIGLLIFILLRATMECKFYITIEYNYGYLGIISYLQSITRCYNL